MKRHKTYTSDLRSTLSEIIKELQTISQASTRVSHSSASSNSSHGSNSSHNANLNSLEMKLIDQNRELLNAIKKLSDEKLALNYLINKLEEEVWRSKNRVSGLREIYDTSMKIRYLSILL